MAVDKDEYVKDRQECPLLPVIMVISARFHQTTPEEFFVVVTASCNRTI